MGAVVQARIIKIGNSQGIRIPKWLLHQVALSGEVEVEAQVDRLIIRSTKKARQGWEQAFQDMAQRGDDQMLDPETSTHWDESEWEW